MQLYYAYYGFGDPLHYKSGEQQSSSSTVVTRSSSVPLSSSVGGDLRQTPYGALAALYFGCGSIINDEDVSYVRLKDQFTMKRRQLLANGMG